MLFNIQISSLNLTNVKELAVKTIQPAMHKLKLCTVMLLSNLAYPEWIHVDCDEKLLSDVVCSTGNPEMVEINVITRNRTRKMCPLPQIMKNSSCYLFLWHKRSRSITETCKQIYTYSLQKMSSYLTLSCMQ